MEPDRRRDRDRERERVWLSFWLKCCTFAWGPVPPPCIGERDRELTWGLFTPKRALLFSSSGA